MGALSIHVFHISPSLQCQSSFPADQFSQSTYISFIVCILLLFYICTPSYSHHLPFLVFCGNKCKTIHFPLDSGVKNTFCGTLWAIILKSVTKKTPKSQSVYSCVLLRLETHTRFSQTLSNAGK